MVKEEKRNLSLLLLFSFGLRLLLAGITELGDDEIYYRLYALFPDWSHFDHPPMVGWLIQLTTLNMLLDHEWAIRLGSVIIGTVNTWLIYRMGCDLRNERTGWIAAWLYTASVYCSVIVGVFILPDTPMSLFWLLTLRIFLRTLPKGNTFNRSYNGWILLSGVWVGAAMLSKYTAVFLWLGAGLYVLLYNREWLLHRWSGYVALLVSAGVFMPVVIWNFQNNFISFTFHEARVTVEAGALLRPDYFAKELFGGILYNNPINWVLYLLTLISLFKQKVWSRGNEQSKLLLCLSLPIIGVFLAVSLFRDTLPHWAAPGYYGLILLTAMELSKKPSIGLPKAVRWANGFLNVGLTAAIVAIYTGFLPMQKPEKEEDLGAWDFTLSLYGMQQAGEKFGELHQRYIDNGTMPADAPIVCDRWFPAAHFDAYLAAPNGTRLLTMGALSDTHKYAWITRDRGGLHLGEDAYGIVSTRFFKDIHSIYGNCFESITPLDTITVERMGNPVYKLFVYKMHCLKRIPDDGLSAIHKDNNSITNQ